MGPDGDTIEKMSVSNLLGSCIEKCMEDNIEMGNVSAVGRNWKDVVLCDGCSLMNGFDVRLEKEVNELFDNKTGIITDAKIQHAVWISASIVSSLVAFEEYWVLKDSYDECGECC